MAKSWQLPQTEYNKIVNFLKSFLRRCHTSTSVFLLKTRDVYHYQNLIQYVSQIHCFNNQYVSSILISSKQQDKQVPALLTGLHKPCFNVHTTWQDSCPAQNGTQSQSLCGIGCLFLSKTLNSSLFFVEFKCVEGRTILNRYSVSTISVYHKRR